MRPSFKIGEIWLFFQEVLLPTSLVKDLSCKTAQTCFSHHSLKDKKPSMCLPAHAGGFRISLENDLNGQWQQ